MILPVNKPPGLSSFDVIRIFKKKAKFTGKVGHAGTLDPFACGLLILLLNSSTKLFDKFQTFKKTYLAGVKLGEKSQTLDVEGNIEKGEYKKISKEALLEVLPQFKGKITQKVPEFSAAKYKGKPLYKLAKKGRVVEKFKEVEVFDAKLVAFKPPLVVLKLTVSSGAYIRSLTFDIFKKLGIDSFLYFLKRETIGPFTLDRACKIEEFENQSWKKKLISPKQLKP